MTIRPAKVILVLCVWCFPLLADGQASPAIDSLIAKADDPARVPESVIIILSEQVAKYQAAADKALLHDRIAHAYMATGVLDSAAVHAWKVLRLVPDDLVLTARAYQTLGRVAYVKKALVRANDFYLRSYRIFNEINDQKGMMEAFTYLGRIAFQKSNPADSRDQYLRALDLANRLSDSTSGNEIKVELVPVYRALGDYHRTQELLDDLARRFRGDNAKLADVFREFGRLEEARKAPRKALANYSTALALDRKTGDPSTSFQRIAQVYFQLGSLDTARLYVDSAELVLMQHRDVRALRDCFELKYRIAEQKKDSAQAYLFFRRYAVYNDSVNMLDVDQRVRHVRDELILDANEGSLRTADLESQLEATQDAQQTQWNNFKLIMGGAAVLFLLLAFAWYRSRSSMEYRMQQSDERVRKAEVDKEKLFTVVSHDLQDSVTTFRNLTRSVGSQLASATAEERNNLLQNLNATSHELRQSLSEMQEWVLSQSGTHPVRPDVFSCRQLAGVAEEDMRGLAEEHGVKIDFLIPDILTAYGDKAMIGLVLRTLLFHAIRSGSEGQTVTIFCGNKEHLITFGVKSSGGIPDFDDESDRTARDAGYPGLAPSLCRELVQHNGGELFVESGDQGATIYFTLPERPTA